MTSRVPSRIDRTTLDRVLQRAAELQRGRDAGDSLSEQETIALGKEVGLPAALVQQALLEEQVRIDVEGDRHGLIDRWVGPADFVAQRVVQGTPEGIIAALSRWMEQREAFVVQRSSSDRATFEPMSGFARGMRMMAAAFQGGNRPYLDKVSVVKAVATPLDAGFCHVALAASTRRSRTGHLQAAAGVLALGAVSAGVFTIVLPLWVGAVLFGGSAAIGATITGVYRSRTQRVQLGLERALDELEQNPMLPHGAAVPPPTGRLARGIGQVVKEISVEVRKALHE